MAADSKNQHSWPTGSDIVGSVQRGLMELVSYLSQPVGDINVDAALKQMDDMAWRLSHLRTQPPAEEAKQGEARAH